MVIRSNRIDDESVPVLDIGSFIEYAKKVFRFFRVHLTTGEREWIGDWIFRLQAEYPRHHLEWAENGSIAIKGQVVSVPCSMDLNPSFRRFETLITWPFLGSVGACLIEMDVVAWTRGG